MRAEPWKKSLKVLFRVLKFSFLFLLLSVVAFLAFVSFFEQRVPRSVLDWACAKCSSTNVLVSVESASFRLARGVIVNNLRVFDNRRDAAGRLLKPAAEPILRIGQLDVDVRPWRLAVEPEAAIRRVTLHGLVYPRLPDGYYIPDSIEFPGQPDFKERDSFVDIPLPELAPFPVRLVDSQILGVVAREITIQSVSFMKTWLGVHGLHLEWPDADVRQTLDGKLELDVLRQNIAGEVHGLARQAHIRPLLEALEITNSYQFVDAWTHVEPPVSAACAFDVNLRNGDLHIGLDLKPKGGRYRDVPLDHTEGLLDINVFVRATNQNARIVVGPIRTTLADRKHIMRGTVLYDNLNEIGTVHFRGVEPDTPLFSNTTLSNALRIANCCTHGELDQLQPGPEPRITLQGDLAVDWEHHADDNNLRGTLDFDAGTLFGVPLYAASTAFHVKGAAVSFTNAQAKLSREGGLLAGTGRIAIPVKPGDMPLFNVALKAEEVRFKDFAAAFNMESGDRTGLLGGRLNLAGPVDVGTNLLVNLVGEGHLACTNGHLARMKIFAGLTDVLSKNVPGISSLSDLDRASFDFTVTNGFFRTENLLVDGDVFSIHGAGSYDMVRDMLDFKVRVHFHESKSLLGKVTLPITMSLSFLSKRLFDFEIKGSLDDPQTSYNKDIFDRLPPWPKIPGLSGDK